MEISINRFDHRAAKNAGASLSTRGYWAALFAIVVVAAAAPAPLLAAGPPPPSQAGLKLWLSADAIDVNDAAAVRVVGGTNFLKIWRNRTGSGVDACQTTTSRQPTLVPNAAGAKPLVKFDGVNDFLKTTLPQIVGNKTIIVVHRRITLPNPSGKEIASTSSIGFFMGNQGNLETQGRIATAHDVKVPGLANELVLKTYIRDGATSTLLVNDEAATSTASDAAYGNYTVSDATAIPYSGAIAEILIYDRALPERERQLLEDYLSEKWALWRTSVPVKDGLQLWLAGDAINLNDPTQVVARDGRYYLKRWQGRSAVLRHAYQTSTAKQPEVIPDALNRRPVVRFDGADDLLTTALPQIKGDKSIYLVMKRTGTNPGYEISSTSNGTNMFLGNNTEFAEAKGRTSNRRTAVAFDLIVPSAIDEYVMKSYIRSGTTETLVKNDAVATTTQDYDFANGYYSLSDGLGSPFAGEIAEVLIYNRALSAAESQLVTDYLFAKWPWTPDNVYSVAPDLAPPAMTGGEPAPGLRVKQTVPAFATSDAYHTLYLPTDWQAGVKYPVIVEYPPNGPNFSDYGDAGSGAVEDMAMGYGISGGQGFIWICMPTIGGSPLSNQFEWWGDLEATKSYCRETVRDVCEQYGGDPARVFVAGFSRGGIACNYLGLNDDAMADIWLGFIPHASYDGEDLWSYPDADPAAAISRFARLKGRPQHVSNEFLRASPKGFLESLGADISSLTFRTLPYGNHTDLWTLRPIQLRRSLRAWVQRVIEDHPGTHSIRGRVSDANGDPVEGVRIESGFTHFTYTAADGTYELGGIIDSTRTVSAAGIGELEVTMAGADLDNVNFPPSPL